MVTHLTKAGLGSLELFSMGLKSTGTYLSRALSYKGAEFSIAKVDIDPQFQCAIASPLGFHCMTSSCICQVLGLPYVHHWHRSMPCLLLHAGSSDGPYMHGTWPCLSRQALIL